MELGLKTGELGNTEIQRIRWNSVTWLDHHQPLLTGTLLSQCREHCA